MARKWRDIGFAIGGVALAALLLAGVVSWRRSQASALPDFGPAPAFTLVDQQERTVRAAELRGRVVVASFIYTHCRDICPVISLRVQQLQERLRRAGLLGDRVQLLSFTVDPARDTPAVLRTYAARHQADPEAWRFLTGPPAEVASLVVEGFRLGVEALPPADSAHGGHADDYEVMHSGRLVLIDPQGRIRAYYDGTTVDLDTVVRDVRALLGRA